jgi:hypothetical protein
MGKREAKEEAMVLSLLRVRVRVRVGTYIGGDSILGSGEVVEGLELVVRAFPQRFVVAGSSEGFRLGLGRHQRGRRRGRRRRWRWRWRCKKSWRRRRVVEREGGDEGVEHGLQGLHEGGGEGVGVGAAVMAMARAGIAVH